MINFYLYLKNGFGFARSFEMAFDIHPLEVLFNVLLIIVGVIMMCWSLNGIFEGLDYEAKQKATSKRRWRSA